MRAVRFLAFLCSAVSASAQDAPTLLQLHPHFGDTLRTLLEQHTEVSMTPSGTGAAAPKSVVTSLAIHSRTIVRAVQSSGTTVLTIVDSARVATSDIHGAKLMADAQRALDGQQLLLELAADGTVESARDSRGVLVTKSVAEAMSAMPAVFPKKAVAVGETWTREMPLPSGGSLGSRSTGKVRATFQLDSVQRGGAVAYLSMRGQIIPDHLSAGEELSGAINGTMQLDRIRGWLTDSRFAITMRTVVAPAAAKGLAPMRFLTKVTQRLRTMDKR
ncbi:MAG: DUF6263 family protein [Gemmatimonadaceae bacterium]